MAGDDQLVEVDRLLVVESGLGHLAVVAVGQRAADRMTGADGGVTSACARKLLHAPTGPTCSTCSRQLTSSIRSTSNARRQTASSRSALDLIARPRGVGAQFGGIVVRVGDQPTLLGVFEKPLVRGGCRR